MTSISLLKTIIGVNDIVIENVERVTEKGEVALYFYIRPYKRIARRCPICGKKCNGYDQGSKQYNKWRGLDANGVKIYLLYKPERIECSEHGVHTTAVPWAFYGSSFTKQFDFQVAWLARNLSKSATSKLMRIDWKTVGRCVERTLNKLEPDRSKRLDNLVNIGIDETSYKKSHKYVTVVVNHDTNEVVWVHDGHGKAVMEKFCNELTEEQKNSIKCVSGDGARWITDCVNEHFKNATRCVDPFHVVGWANDMLDSIRRQIWREYYEKAQAFKKAHKASKGRPSKDDANALKKKLQLEEASKIKDTKLLLLKGQENLTEKQEIRIQALFYRNPRLANAYSLKEDLRLILKLTDKELAAAEIDHWCYRASHCKAEEIKDLARKIKRHKDNILNTIEFGLSNARIESTNNKIKLLIRKSFGFRNLENMFAMIYLNCSKLEIPLPNRYGTTPATAYL